MRIIAGKFRGQKLVSFDSDVIRPYTDRIKESVFSSLQHEIIQARVLDLFCGSGSIGLEALSRGAQYVHFNDISHKSVGLLKKNLEKLKIEEKYYTISRRNADDLLKDKKLRYNIIFLDPPFAFDEWPKLNRLLVNSNRTDKSLIIARYPVSLDVEFPSEMNTVKDKKYGKSIVKYLEIEK